MAKIVEVKSMHISTSRRTVEDQLETSIEVLTEEGMRLISVANGLEPGQYLFFFETESE